MIYFKLLSDFIANTTLSFTEKNKLFHEYLNKNLHLYEGLNPTLIHVTDKTFDYTNQKPFTNISTLVNKSDCLATIENTEDLIATSISKAGKTCAENYKEHPGNNKAIIKLIDKLFEEITN